MFNNQKNLIIFKIIIPKGRPAPGLCLHRPEQLRKSGMKKGGAGGGL